MAVPGLSDSYWADLSSWLVKRFRALSMATFWLGASILLPAIEMHRMLH